MSNYTDMVTADAANRAARAQERTAAAMEQLVEALVAAIQATTKTEDS